MGDAFSSLYRVLVEQAEDDESLQQGKRLYFRAVKEAIRQLFQVSTSFSKKALMLARS